MWLLGPKATSETAVAACSRIFFSSSGKWVLDAQPLVVKYRVADRVAGHFDLQHGLSVLQTVLHRVAATFDLLHKCLIYL